MKYIKKYNELIKENTNQSEIKELDSNILDIYNKIYKEQLLKCIKHSIKYNLGRNYNEKHDAIGLTYYKIKELYSDNKELVEYAYKRFLK